MTALEHFEVLQAVERATRQARREKPDGWVRPMDCGGADRSRHSKILKQLASYGLVDFQRRSRGPRGSYLYRINKPGELALAAFRELLAS